ncbi:MAG: class I SAM-dependent methyltransferase [Candidatus Nanopelagicales bacterium]|nr:class I SAM-dependent methyltransferase [Candidatus Nanopelagicales bacterium]MCF8557996.1 class I SAM-dependent methyltransferase [Candidatus Nanopelagicales bacterium]
MDLKELDLVDPSTHWYYQAKLVAVRKAITDCPRDQVVIDVGAGSGFFGRGVAAGVDTKTVICVDPNYTDEQLGTHDGATFTRSVDPVEISTTGLLLFIDVLEHVDDDVGLLRSYVEAAPSGARVVITVPAFMSLWSSHDDFLEHRRRYTRGQIAAVACSAGLNVRDSYYLFGLVTPIAWITRKVRRGHASASDLKPLPAPVNVVLRRLLAWEHAFVTNRVVGLSAMVVGEKPTVAPPDDSTLESGNPSGWPKS